MMDPRELDNQLKESPKGTGLLKNVAKAGVSMLAFGVANTVFRAAGTAINTKGLSLLKSFAEATTLAAVGNTSKLAQVTTRLTRNILPALTEITERTRSTMQTLSGAIKEHPRFKQTFIGKAIRRLDRIEGQTLHKMPTLERAKLSPVFGRSRKGAIKQYGLDKVATGKLWRFAKSEAGALPFFYGMNRMMTRSQPDRKAWYHPKSIGSFLTSEAVGGLTMSGMGSAGRALLAGPLQKLARSYGEKHGQKFQELVKKTLAFADRHRGKRVAAASETMKQMRHDSGFSTKNPIGMLDRLFERVEQFRSRYSSNKQRQNTLDLQRKRRILTQRSDRRAGRLPAGSRNVEEMHISPVERAHAQIEHMFDHDQAQGAIFKPHEKRITQENFASDRGVNPHKQSLNFVNLLAGKKDFVKSAAFKGATGKKIYHGQGFLEVEGTIMDASAFMPKNLVGAAVSLFKEARVLGHSPASLLNISSISDLAQSKDAVFTMGAGHSVNLAHAYVPDATEFLNAEILQGIDPNYLSKKTLGKMTRRLTDEKGKPLNRNQRRSRYFDPEARHSRGEQIFEDLQAATIEHADRLSTTDRRIMSTITDSGLHGEFQVGVGQKVHSILGRMYLQTESKNRVQNLYEFGINTRTGNPMRYRSLPVNAGGVFASFHNKYMGGHEAQINSENGEIIQQHVGYGGVDLVERRPIGERSMARMMEKFDLGGKGERTVFGRVGAWFKSFTNPYEPRVLLQKNMLRDPNLRDSISRSDPSTVKRLTKIVGGTLDELNHRAYKELFGSEESVRNVNEYLKSKGMADRLFEMKDIINSDLGSLTDAIQGVRNHLGQETLRGNPALSKALSVFEDHTKGVSGQSVFSVARKVGDMSITYLDEINNAIASHALASLGQAEKAGAYQTMFGSASKSKWIRMYEQSNTIANVKTATNVNNAHLNSQRHLNYMMDILKDNQDLVDAHMKKNHPIWSMGNIIIDDKYANPMSGSLQSRLFIAEKMDVEGMPVNSGISNILPAVKNKLYARDTLTIGGAATGAAIESINNVANVVGLGFRAENSRTVGMFAKNLLTKRALPLAGALAAWNAADTIVDESGVFDNTGLSEGLNVFMASQLMKARLTSARVMDMTGVTTVASKIEELMPGSITSPLSGIARGFGAPLIGGSIGMSMMGPAGGLIGGAIGGVLSLVTAGGPIASTGAFDITKSRKDLIEEYSGRKKVPYVTDKGWPFGTTPMVGTKVHGFVPNWFARMRSNYQNTPEGFGTKFERLTSYLNDRDFEEKNYYSRPYPYASNGLQNVPMVNNMISWGKAPMHQKELQEWIDVQGGGGGSSVYGSAYDMNVGSTGSGYGTDPSNPLMLREQTPISPNNPRAMASNMYDQTVALAGLRGFATNLAMDKFRTSGVTAEMPKIFADSGYAKSTNKWFWDQAVGDIMGTGEFIRRMTPQHKGGDYVNPLPNLMPDWMPSSYQTGDPFTQIALGELRLPGQGYESANDVDLTFPGEVELVGSSVEQTAMHYLFGKRDRAAHHAMAETMKEKVRNQLAQANGEATINAPLFDARLNLSGRADVLSAGIAYKIKTVDAKEFDKIDGVTPDMELQLNMIGKMAGSTGAAMYVNAETGDVKQFNVAPNLDKFYQGVSMLESAKSHANDLVRSGKYEANYHLGNAYSRLDRLKILADIAPNSPEFHEVYRQVQALQSSGVAQVGEDEIDNIERMRFIQNQPKPLYPYRFKTLGEATSIEGRARDDRIRAGTGFLTRQVGAAWETISHANTMVHRKFMDINSPYEAYDRTSVGGKAVKLWNHPYSHFVRPYMSNMATRDSISENMVSGMTGGMIFGGPLGAVAGAGMAGIAAAFNSTFNGRQVPGWRDDQRNIDMTLDKVEYQKSMNLYQQTGDIQYMNRAKKTMTHFNMLGEAGDIAGLKSSSPYAERKYIEALVAPGSEAERSKIMKILPENVQAGIKRYFAEDTRVTNGGMSAEAQQMYDSIDNRWTGWLQHSDMSLIKTKIMNNEGIDARESGVGWRSHISDIGRSALLPESFSDNMKVDVSQVQAQIQAALSGLGEIHVSVTPTLSTGTSINLTVVKAGTL